LRKQLQLHGRDIDGLFTLGDEKYGVAPGALRTAAPIHEARFRLNDINFASDEMPVKHKGCRVGASTTELIP
jgi:hypothetical protein